MATKTLTVRPLLRSHPLKTTLSSRTFHSYDHPPPPGPFNATESLILSAGAPYVPAHGFTHKALSLGAKDAGYIDASTNLFPAGPFALVHWHLHEKRVGLAGRCRDVFENKAGVDRGEKMGIGQKVKALTWERLMGNREVIGRWQEALALMALPSNLLPSFRELNALSDEIWFLSGDVSVDTSWYTKRVSLSTIYAATELFMTTDQSTEFRDTREFLDRRFRDVQVVGGAMGGLAQWVGFTASAAVNVARSKGVRI